MENPKFDPGLTQQYNGALRRAINRDGTFNVVRRGTGWHDIHPYLHLVSMSWPAFFVTLLSAYCVVNCIFACIYAALGPDALQGGGGFAKAFYFSSQTLTTVGFGSVAPKTDAANLIAAFEALLGLLSFAVATGLLFGRVSRPSARIGFSPQAIVAPYQNGASLQFRIVNRRANTLIDVEATITLMTVVRANGVLKREYAMLELERSKVMMFPLTWTIVHPIAPGSPLNEKTAADLEEVQAELLILVKAWDETFSQTVHQRYSYRFDEIVWGARFAPAFAIGEDGDMVLDIGKVGDHISIAALSDAR